MLNYFRQLHKFCIMFENIPRKYQYRFLLDFENELYLFDFRYSFEKL